MSGKFIPRKKQKRIESRPVDEVMTRVPPRMESGLWRKRKELKGFCVLFL